MPVGRHARIPGAREANRRKGGKRFDVAVHEGGMDRARNAGRMAAEARLDGVCVVRASLGVEAVGTGEAVEDCKSLAGVERAFRNAKGDLRIRPVHVCPADHVRARVFPCTLALHVERRMRRRLASMLFEDDDRAGARAQRNSPVERAGVSARARARADTKRTPDGLHAHSFLTLLDDRAGMALNQLRLPGRGESELAVVTKPARVRERAFGLLGVKPDRNVPMRMIRSPGGLGDGKTSKSRSMAAESRLRSP